MARLLGFAVMAIVFVAADALVCFFETQRQLLLSGHSDEPALGFCLSGRNERPWLVSNKEDTSQSDVAIPMLWTGKYVPEREPDDKGRQARADDRVMRSRATLCGLPVVWQRRSLGSSSMPSSEHKNFLLRRFDLSASKKVNGWSRIGVV